MIPYAPGCSCGKIVGRSTPAGWEAIVGVGGLGMGGDGWEDIVGGWEEKLGGGEWHVT